MADKSLYEGSVAGNTIDSSAIIPEGGEEFTPAETPAEEEEISPILRKAQAQQQATGYRMAEPERVSKRDNPRDEHNKEADSGPSISESDTRRSADLSTTSRYTEPASWTQPSFSTQRSSLGSNEEPGLPGPQLTKHLERATASVREQAKPRRTSEMLTLDTAGNPYTEASANAPRDPAAEARRALNPAEGLIQSTQYFNLSHPSGYIQNPVAAGTFSSSREIGASSEQGGAGGGNSRKSSAPYVASGSAAAAALTGESLDDEARDRPWWAPVWDVAASVGTFIGDGLINLDERFWRWNNSR